MYYILIFIKTPHDFVCCSAELVLFTHCQKRDFGAKKCSVLSKILIGFSENPLELGKIEGDSWTQIFTAFSMQRGAESLENTAFSGLSHLPLSSVKFCQVRFWQLDSKCRVWKNKSRDRQSHTALTCPCFLFRRPETGVCANFVDY